MSKNKLICKNTVSWELLSPGYGLLILILSISTPCFYSIAFQIASSSACATDETKLWLSPSAKQRRNPCSGSPPVYQDLSTRHDWPDIKAIVDLPMRLKRNSKRTSGNSLNPLRAQNKDIGAVSQTLLTEVKLRLRRRIPLP